MTSSGRILAGDYHDKPFQHADDICLIFALNQETAQAGGIPESPAGRAKGQKAIQPTQSPPAHSQPSPP
jgi:hypothetical protein